MSDLVADKDGLNLVTDNTVDPSRAHLKRGGVAVGFIDFESGKIHIDDNQPVDEVVACEKRIKQLATQIRIKAGRDQFSMSLKAAQAKANRRRAEQSIGVHNRADRRRLKALQRRGKV